MSSLRMKLGSNIGSILLDIAQTAIQEGNIQKAIDTYQQSLPHFTEEYVIALLKNEIVLATEERGLSVVLTDDPEILDKNKKNIQDWNLWLSNKVDYLELQVRRLRELERTFNTSSNGYNILDYDLQNLATISFSPSKAYAVNLGLHNIVARLIAGESIDWSQEKKRGLSNAWTDLCTIVEVTPQKAGELEIVLYCTVKYIDGIRSLLRDYVGFSNTYKFLIKNGLVTKGPAFMELKLEPLIDILYKFTDPEKGYKHPICNERLLEFKKQTLDELMSSAFGNDYIKRGILEKNILDGYDAGWLSPDGKFYGMNGSAEDLLHMRIADKILQDGDGLNKDRELEKLGWLRIHGPEAYGSFARDKNLYCPSEIQVKLICDYIDKHHSGQVYTRPAKWSKPVSTYNLRQMDRPRLRETFK